MAVMNGAKINGAKKIQEILGEATAPTLLLVAAPDRIRLERIIQLYTQKFVGRTTDALASGATISGLKLKRFDCRGWTTSQVARLREELRARLLFSKHQFFIVDRIEALEAKVARELAETLGNIPSDSAVLVVGQGVKETHPCLKFAEKSGISVVLPELKGVDLKKWVRREFAELGVTEIADQLVEAVIAVGKGSPDILTGMVERLVIYADDRAPTEGDLDRLFVAETELSEFRLLDAVVHQNPALAHVLLRELLHDGKNPFLLFSMLSRTAAQYFMIAFCLRSGEAPAAVRDRLEINPWVFSRQVEIAKKMSLARGRQLLGATVLADSTLKNHSLGPTEILDCFLGELRDSVSKGADRGSGRR